MKLTPFLLNIRCINFMFIANIALEKGSIRYSNSFTINTSNNLKGFTKHAIGRKRHGPYLLSPGIISGSIGYRNIYPVSNNSFVLRVYLPLFYEFPWHLWVPWRFWNYRKVTVKIGQEITHDLCFGQKHKKVILKIASLILDFRYQKI